MTSFLKQVAEYYVGKALQKNAAHIDLSEYVFVFPNKRSGMFMSKYLKEGYDNVGFLPQLITITTFTQDFNEMPLASSAELLFNLYEAYQEVMAEINEKAKEEGKGQAPMLDFDRFAYWGNILLSDFNDIDSYQVNAQQLYTNLKNIEETQATFLTDEQIKVAAALGIKRDLSELSQDVKNFWIHAPSDKDDDRSKRNFVNLWRILPQLYSRFNQKIDKNGIAYSGKLSRLAAEKIAQMGVEDFHGKRYVFVGFNVLSTSRIHIFRRMQTLRIADFFWDTQSPMLRMEGCTAGDLVLPLERELPMPSDFRLKALTEMPEVQIYPVPSNVGQTKIIGSILKEWYGPGQGEEAISTDTGVVLPNEHLLMPMLYSLPAEVPSINVAMRVNFSDTPFANFLSTIFFLQENARIVRGSTQFFYKHVVEVLTHPYASLIDAAQTRGLYKKIRDEHLYNIDATMIEQDYDKLAFVFRGTDKDHSLDATYKYVVQLLDGMLEAVKKDEKNTKAYEIGIITAYRNAIDNVYALAQRYAIDMRKHTFFTLLRHVLAIEDMQFNGNPVLGLQIMGMRDSRVLDFENLIIASLNERIMPKHNARPSMIPPALRSGYGLPTAQQEEISWSYQFYRLISRAKRICLLYDSRLGDLNTGEVSRYITQLQMLFPNKTHTRYTNVGFEIKDPQEIKIDKGHPFVRALIERFLPGAENPLKISASALKAFTKCELQFFLRFVMKLNIESPNPEYMDAASYGQIIHAVAEDFYNGLYQGGEHYLLTKDDFDRILSDKTLYQRLLQYTFKNMVKYYYKGDYADYKSLPGEGRVLTRVIVDYVMMMLRKEHDNGDFAFLSAEERGGENLVWEIKPGLSVNFTMSIDRIDTLNADKTHLRFVDYKTGSEDMSVKDLEEMFSGAGGGIFQLLLYAMAYSDIKQVDVPITPMIYKFIDMATNGIPKLKIGKQEINDYRQLEGDEPNSLRNAFRERVAEMVEKILDTTPGATFSQTDNLDHCRYCDFAHLCGRPKIKKKF